MLKEQELKELFDQQDETCVSIFMPLQWQPEQRDANRIRLKNLIKQAEQKLTGVPNHPSQLLAPALELLASGRLQQTSSVGLALFLKPDFERHYFLPATMPELVIVGQRFHTKPLLPLLHNNEQFYILALSQNDVRLFEANRYHIKPMSLPEMPESMSEALYYEEYEKQLQYHVSTEQNAMYHGHEVSAEKKGAVRRYFRQINEVLAKQLQAPTPLLLACVDYLLPLYQEVNSYPNLLEQNISGNPDEAKPNELREQAWHIVSSRFEEEKTAAIQQYQAVATTERASAQLPEIIAAAHNGRVDTLFTPIGQQQWGQFDASSGTVKLCQQAEPDMVDLLDETAVHTLLNGGTVYALEPQEMPDDALLTAVFRY